MLDAPTTDGVGESASRSPSLLRAYLRALLGVRKPRTVESLPALQASQGRVRVEAATVARFRTLFGLPSGGPVPPTFAHVLASALQLQVLTDPHFPLRVLGTLHVRNPILQRRALRIGEQVALRVATGALRAVPQGLEYDLVTCVDAGAEGEIWRGVSTYLLRSGKGKGPRSAADVPAPERVWEREWGLALDAAVGRRYAAVSGDWNPIHLSALSARPFGFRSAIVHGMWTYARALAALEPHLPGEALAMDVQFRRPLLLPGRARILASRQQAPAGWHWRVADGGGTALHAEGSVVALGR